MRNKMPIYFCALAAAALAIGFSGTGADAADPANAKAKFQQLCVSCHGPEGKGNGPAAAALNPKPQDLTDITHMKQYSDEILFKIIKMGGAAAGKSPMMPPWAGALTDKDIRDMVAFIRTFAKPKK